MKDIAQWATWLMLNNNGKFKAIRRQFMDAQKLVPHWYLLAARRTGIVIERPVVTPPHNVCQGEGVTPTLH